MVHGRIEPSPAEQLVELRRSRDRYAALAEKLHDDPELTLEDKLAREQDARRIAHAYENSITNAVARMTSLESTHRAFHFSLGMRAWLAIFVAISIFEGGVLLAYFRPEIFRLTMPQKNALNVELVASIPAAPKVAPPLVTPPRPSAAPSVLPTISAAPKPIMRPETAPKPVSPAPQIAKAVAPPPVSPAPKPLVQPAMLAVPKPLTPPQLELIAPPPVDVPPLPVIVLEEPPPTAQSAPAPTTSAPVTPSPAPATSAPATATPATPITAAPTAAAATAQPTSPPATAVPPPTRIEAIAGTHTLPPYPDTSKRLAESGTTRMQVAISTLGTATECTIVKSSGSARLDIAACSHVQAIWRWKPATRDGQPVAANAVVTVVWSLLNAR